MSRKSDLRKALDASDLAADLKVRICELVDSLVSGDEEQAGAHLESFLLKANELVRRKRAFEGTKHETRDLLGELLFTRLRRGMRRFVGSQDPAERA